MKRRRRRRPATTILILLFVVGVAVMLYPSVANLWNTHYQKNLIRVYQQDMTEQADAAEINYEYEREMAMAYNHELWPTPTLETFSFLREEDPSPEYMDCLNVNGDGIMGSVEVPKINIEIPIYHTTDEIELLNGAGHLEGTSLPVGGESTHSVIAAHRGLPGAELFTNLDKMELGDHFFLHILDETLAYEVDQIKEVPPEDVSDLVITGGEDLCTLLTCTPYGINTDRLLVRGHRVPYDEAMAESENEGPVMKLEYWLILAAIAVAAVGIIILVTSRRKQNRAQFKQ